MVDRPIVITGITGLANRGVEALLIPVVEQLRHRLGAEIKILTDMADRDRRRLQADGVTWVQNDLDAYNAVPLSRYRRLRRRVGRMLGRQRVSSPAMQVLQGASMVVAAGGDVFSSDYGNLKRHLRPLEIAQRSGVPVVFLAQSIGPFRTSSEVEDWTRVARRSPLITVRESMSYNYLINDLGISKDRVHLTADPAFLLGPAADDISANMCAHYGLAAGQKTIAVSISSGISRFANLDADRHLAAWKRLIDHIISATDVNILIVPHVQLPNLDDRHIGTDMLRMFQYNGRVRLASGDHTAAEFKGLIKKCDMVIAERMHVGIAGLSSEVCTVVISYSVKAEGIMRDIAEGHALMADLVIPVGSFVVDPSVPEQLLSVWERRAEIRAVLQERRPSLVALAHKNFELIEGLRVHA